MNHPTALVLHLPTLADRINHEHQACEHAYRGALEHAYQTGRLLLEAKSSVQHGEWLPWLRENIVLSERQARNYMRLAENWEAIDTANRQRATEISPTDPPELTDLSVRAALKLIATNTTPPTVHGVHAHEHQPDSHHEPLPIELKRSLCPHCLQPVLQVVFAAEPYEWEQRAECQRCQQTRRAHPGSHVNCANCGDTGMVGTQRPRGRMLAIDIAWSDEPGARIIAPGTDRRSGEALHALHVCSDRMDP